MSHIPFSVFIIFALLVWVGIRYCFPRRMRIERLLLMPGLMLFAGIHGFIGLFPTITSLDIGAAVVGGLLGMFVGQFHVGRWAITVDRSKRVITVPGDILMLIIIFLIFGFEFGLHYGVESQAAWSRSADLAPMAALIWSLFIGMSAGRNLSLARRYFSQAATPQSA
jgi:MFS-type transporter involved in bile tolerance (Atg22 family)